MTRYDIYTTLATGAALLVQRAESRGWSWPLVHQTRWAVLTVAILAFLTFYYGFLQDREATDGWSVTGYIVATFATIFAALGIIIGNAGFLVLLTATAVIMWATSVVEHLFSDSEQPHAGTPSRA